MGFVFHLAGGEPKKSLHERGEGRKQAHLWLCQPHLCSPITIPPGKVWQRERDKGRGERERKEEIVGEIYRPLLQLTEGWVNLLLIIRTQNKLDWWWRKTQRSFQRQLWASCECRPQPIYPDDMGLFLCIDCINVSSSSSSSWDLHLYTTQRDWLTNAGKHKHMTDCGYKPAET